MEHFKIEKREKKNIFIPRTSLNFGEQKKQAFTIC